jgi:hypothetical protein
MILSLLLQSALLAPAASAATLPAQTTLPVVFPHTISARSAHAGETIEAKTTAPVHLQNGMLLHKGAVVRGHVVEAAGFAFNNTPYAHQKPGTLTIAFDTVQDHEVTIPLHATLRALADPLASWDTQRPLPSDVDPEHTLTQVGGDQVTPSQKAVLSPDGDIVGYQHGDSVYAHLISSGGCDGSDTEQAMGIFSASACGVYGMPDTAFANTTTDGAVPTITLSSSRYTPEIHSQSHALLEEIAPAVQTAAR